MDEEFYQTHQRRGCIFTCITALARLSGLITLIGLIFVTYLQWLADDVWSFRVYVTVVTAVVGYLEVLWILDKCITCCICCFRSEACFYWVCCIPIDNWLKTILYICLSIPLFIPTWLSKGLRIDIKIVGALLTITGLLYFIKSFKYKRIDMDDPKEDHKLVHTRRLPTRPSISTQTSIVGINNDSVSAIIPTDEETNKGN